MAFTKAASSSRTLLYLDFRPIPTYMAAIIRRHRFVILVFICLIMFVMLSWHVHKKEKYKSKRRQSLPKLENFNDENEILQSDTLFTYDVDEIYNTIDKISTAQVILLENEETELSVPLTTGKEPIQHQPKESRHFFPTTQKAGEFTSEGTTQLNAKLEIGGEKSNVIPTIQHLEIQPPSPSNIGTVGNARYTDLKQSTSTIPQNGKAVTNLQQDEEDFPAPDVRVELSKKDTTLSMPGNRNNTIVLSSRNNKITLKTLKIPKIKSLEKKAQTIPTFHHLETESPSPLKMDTVGYPKYLDLNKSTFSFQQNDKSVTHLKQPEEGFFAPDLENEWTKTGATLSMPKNRSNTIGFLNQSKNILPNLQKLPPFNSTNTNSAILIDTPGCKIPRLDPWDPSVKDLIELQDPYVCPGPPVFLKSNPGGSITYNETILETYYNITAEELVCFYEPIHRDHEREEIDREISFTIGDKVQLPFGIPLNEDYARTSCDIKGNNYQQYFPLVRIKEDVEAKRNSAIPPSPPLNVILLGIDSVSKLNFLRHFPRTYAFLNEKLTPFEMNGYTKVGDNTFPNLIPLLTGKFVEYWWNETVKNTMFFDNVGFIWKKYAKRGYRTFYAEDNPFAGTFNYIKRGFYDPPTDYYFRPMALAMEMWKYILKSEKQFCFRSQIDYDIIYDYLKVFTQTMEDRPYFGFAMLSTITHDKLNNAGFADEPTVRLLEGLLNTGALNNTMLVLFSDHGLRFGKIRYTYVGKYEERLPLMYIHFPQWFLDQYPEIAKNMQINQDRLITLLDVHATMLHLLDLDKSLAERSKSSLGRSLLEEISPNRTCDDAYIQTHWCPCQTFNTVDLNSPEAINASQAMVDDINSKLEPYGTICEILEVDTIIDARVGKANELMLQYLRSENEVINKTIYVGEEVISLDDYLITLDTKPGGAVFEGTVRHNPENNSYSVLGLSRISMYGNTSWCIDSQIMKKFCFCKIQQLT